MDEKISLKWNNYSTTLLSSLQRFQNKEQLCDSTLVCGEIFYPVHRLILSLCSEHFERIYKKVMCKHPFVIISDIEPIYLKAILDFMYHGEVEISNDFLPHFLKASEALKIKGLTYDLNNNHFKIKTVRQHYSKRVGDSRKFQTNDANIIKRMPIIINPILSLKRLDESINFNDVSHQSVINNGANNNIRTSGKRMKCKGSSHLLHSELHRTDNSNASNNSSFRNDTTEDLEHYHYADLFPNITDETDIVKQTNINCSSNLIENELTSEITINSYSGACNEEFEAASSATDFQNEEDVEIKVEIPEFFMDEDGYLERPLTDPLKSELLFDTEAKALENGFLEDLSTNKIFIGDTEDKDSKKNAFTPEPSVEPNMCFSSIGLMAPVSGNKLQSITENCSQSQFDKLQCKLCPYVCRKKYLQIHESAHASRFSYKCKFCWYRSVMKWNTVKHQKYCIKGKSIKGSCASQSQEELKNLKKAFKISLKPKNSKYKCNFCSYSSKYAGYVKMHQRSHSTGKLKCNLCSFTSIFEPVMTKHKLRVHNKFSNLITNKIKKIKCRECPFSSKHRSVIDKHQNCHASNKLYKCRTCSFSANIRGFVFRHELLHYGVKKKTHLKNFLQTGAAKSKFAFKQFNCGLCKFSSKYKMVVSRHERVHIKKKFIVSQKGSLDAKSFTHLLIHKESNKLRKKTNSAFTNKMYKCRFCPYAADLNVRILQHESHHKIKKQHKCSKCSFSSDNIGRINDHTLLHNIINTEKNNSSLSETSNNSLG